MAFSVPAKTIFPTSWIVLLGHNSIQCLDLFKLNLGCMVFKHNGVFEIESYRKAYVVLERFDVTVLYVYIIIFSSNDLIIPFLFLFFKEES